jgi:hypothetical protein
MAVDSHASRGYLSTNRPVEREPTEAPSAPILLVNGRDDLQNWIQDIYLSPDHGDPKSARVFDGGHMGERPPPSDLTRSPPST